jgi:hypothetical protein
MVGGLLSLDTHVEMVLWILFKKQIAHLIVVHPFSIYLVNMIRMVHLLVCVRIFCFWLMSETMPALAGCTHYYTLIATNYFFSKSRIFL